MDYIKEYEKWLASCALSQSELAEIKSISEITEEVLIINRFSK